HWFRGKLEPFLRETILSEKALNRGLFKPAAVKRLVDQHVGRERDLSHQLWTLLMLGLWFQRFIDYFGLSDFLLRFWLNVMAAVASPSCARFVSLSLRDDWAGAAVRRIGLKPASSARSGAAMVAD